MARLNRLACAFLALWCGTGFSQNAPAQMNEAQISESIGSLRQLPDQERAKVTKKLALSIRALPASDSRLNLALSLSNLATEGDFGRDTLQEVTTTLALALESTPIHATHEGLSYAYTVLADLKTYEGMEVRLNAADFQKALALQAETDEKRAKADFTLQDLNGKSWTLSALKGKVVLVNFWATWCPPCRKEMPDLDSLYKEFGPKGFVILAISSEKADVVSKFISSHGYSYPVLLDSDASVNKKFFIQGIPKSFIYNREGKLVAQTIDMRTRAQFLNLLARAGLK